MTHSGEFSLTIEAGGTIGQTFRLTPGTFVIGRAPTNQIVINHPAVSKEHAQLTVQPDGLYLTDMGSSNGTFVNGRPISQSTWLKAGDTLRIGTEVTLKLHQGGITAGGGSPVAWLSAGALALIGLLLIAGIGLAAWFLLSNRTASPTTGTPAPVMGATATIVTTPAPPVESATTSPATSPAAIIDFSSSKTTVPLGECITLRWQVDNAREVRLDGELVPATDSRQVCPRDPSKIYRLTATSENGETIEQTVTVSVPPTLPPPPEIAVDFSVDQRDIAYGSCTTLRWTVSSAQAVLLNGEKTSLTGSEQVCPTAPSTSYRLNVLPLEGQPVEQIVVVNVAATPVPSATPTPTPLPTATSPPQAPGINKFIADQYNLPYGSCTILRWEVFNAHTARLDGGVVPNQGSQQVCPPATTNTYTLTATGNGGTVQASVTLTVLVPTHTPVIVAPPPPPPPSGPPIIIFSADETTIRYPNCTTIRWHVENVREIYLEGQDVPREGVVGDGSKRVCPSLSSSLYKLIIILRDGSVHEEKLYITVVG